MSQSIIWFSIPFFIVAMVIEYLIGKRKGVKLYSGRDTLANLACGLLSEAVGIGIRLLVIPIYSFVYERIAPLRLWELSGQIPTLIRWSAAFVAVDFCYYWFHRASHRINFLWACHAVHHQSEEYNYSVALRQSALGGFFSWVFYLPLAVLGLPTGIWLTCYSVNLVYQFVVHTKLVKEIGVLKVVLNSTSHHRVHHARDFEYLDKNYAGTFIVWDHAFGTFKEESTPIHYGTVEPLGSFNPIWANLAIWARIAATARRGAVLSVLLAPPENLKS